MHPNCEFCDSAPTRIHIPQYGPVVYGARLSCDRHRHWVRRLIVLDLGSGYTRELPGCTECDGPVTPDRLPPAYATPVCHECLPPPPPLRIVSSDALKAVPDDTQ